MSKFHTKTFFSPLFQKDSPLPKNILVPFLLQQNNELSKRFSSIRPKSLKSGCGPVFISSPPYPEVEPKIDSGVFHARSTRQSKWLLHLQPSQRLKSDRKPGRTTADHFSFPFQKVTWLLTEEQSPDSVVCVQTAEMDTQDLMFPAVV